MSVRNCAEMGLSLQKIVKRLLENDALVNLLYYEDKDPLNHLSLTAEEKQTEIFEKLIRVIPKVGSSENVKSIIVVYITRGSKISSNNEFTNITITVDVFVPLTQWVIKDSNLRPFAILGQIQESLEGKTINGLGKLSGGNFELVASTDETSCYRQTFSLTNYV
jgi:hypothetical protein